MLSQPTPTLREYSVLHVASVSNDASAHLLQRCIIEIATLERVEFVFSIQIMEVIFCPMIDLRTEVMAAIVPASEIGRCPSAEGQL